MLSDLEWKRNSVSKIAKIEMVFQYHILVMNSEKSKFALLVVKLKSPSSLVILLHFFSYSFLDIFWFSTHKNENV